MAKTKDTSTRALETLGPYVKQAMEDPDLRDDLLAAFVAARGLYGQLAKSKGVGGKAAKVQNKKFQEEIQSLVAELTSASERIQGGKGKKKRKSHRTRNRVVFLTGVTLGVLYNPWTGTATRDWIMGRVAGDGGSGIDELAGEGAAGNGSEPEASEPVSES
jgi:hypothetical protein